MSFKNAIELHNVTKSYDGFTLDNVSFNVPKGSVCGFIGQNGAGKTTTINAILNIIPINSGNIKILGYDNNKDEKIFKQKISAVFDELPFPENLNANQLNKIMKGIYKEWESETFFNYLTNFNIPVKRKFANFSKGMKMKLQIAVALSHNSDLLIMDEATAGLDPIVRNEILDIFMDFMQDENHSILMSSHITTDLERMADTIVFINNGKILLSGNKDEILESHGLIKCSKSDVQMIDKKDIISTRSNEFGVEMMTSDINCCRSKYPDLIIEKSTLEEIMLFYVNAQKESDEV